MNLALLPAVRILFRLVKSAGLFALAGCLPSYIPVKTSSAIPGQEIITFIVIAAAIYGAIFGVWKILLPLRLTLFRFICKLLIHSGNGFLLLFGVWELLSVGVRVRKFGVPDFTGVAALHKTYDSLDRFTKAHVVTVVRILQGSPPCGVYQEAILFLDAVNY